MQGPRPENFGARGGVPKTIGDRPPGWRRGRRVQRVSPTRVGLPGKRGASRSGGSPRTQRGAGVTPLRPQSNPRGLGTGRWATRTGLAVSACWLSGCRLRKRGGCPYGGMSLSRLRSGGNPRPVPTGPALRPVKEHGVSAFSRHRLCGETRAGWSVSSQPPEGDWREGHREGGLRAEIPWPRA